MPDTASTSGITCKSKPLESLLASHTRILNVTKGYSMKRGAAERAICECAAAWVEYGVSIRNLTLAEAINARNEQAKLREPLPYAEIHGLRFDPPVTGIPATRRENRMVWEAHNFAMSATA